MIDDLIEMLLCAGAYLLYGAILALAFLPLILLIKWVF